MIYRILLVGSVAVALLTSCDSSQGADSQNTASETLSAPASQAEPISLFGTIQNANGQDRVQLRQFENNRQVASYDLEVDANGHFAYSLALSQPTLFQLGVNNLHQILMVLHNEDVEITVDGLDPGVAPETEGSSDTDYLEEIMQIAATNQELQVSLQERFLAAKNANDQEAINQLMLEGQAGMDTMEQALISLLTEKGPSLSAIQAMQYISERPNLDFLENFAEKMLAVLPSDAMVKGWYDRIQLLAATKVGASAPDLQYPTPTGETFGLSQLKGKYVLIDFWASWCGPCRAENPNLVNAYNIYKDQGFTVLGVSLDQNGEKWVDAIAQDGLVWDQVSDLGGWRSQAAAQYGVSAIPANFLVDPEGKIIATDLRGPALHTKLQEIFTD